MFSCVRIILEVPPGRRRRVAKHRVKTCG